MLSASDPIQTAARLIDAGSLRAEVFGTVADGFGDPCWWMLLHLFVASGCGAVPVDAAELHDVSGTGRDNAATYLLFLKSHRIVTLENEGRAGAVTLSEKGASLMRSYLGKTGL